MPFLNPYDSSEGAKHLPTTRIHSNHSKDYTHHLRDFIVKEQEAVIESRVICARTASHKVRDCSFRIGQIDSVIAAEIN